MTRAGALQGNEHVGGRGFPTFPIPNEKTVGGINFQYSGLPVTIKQEGFDTKIHFTGKAFSGGDLASFMKLEVPVNRPGPTPVERPAPTEVDVGFRNKESATDCAKALEKALKSKVKGGYGITRHGATVSIQMFMMR